MIADTSLIPRRSKSYSLLPSHKIAEDQVAACYAEQFLPGELSSLDRTTMKDAFVKATNADLGVCLVRINFN